MLAEALQLKKDNYVVTFQSRFGKAKWLEPYTAPILKKLGEGGAKRVDITCPSFAADCLETLEEIAIEGRAIFLSAGGKDYEFIPRLNERDTWIWALMMIALENLLIQRNYVDSWCSLWQSIKVSMIYGYGLSARVTSLPDQL